MKGVCMILYSKNIYLPQGRREGYIKIENTKISEIFDTYEGEFLDYSDYLIIPGLFDVHNHGTNGYSLMNRTSDVKEQLEGFQKACASYGITSVLPTASPELFSDIVEVIKEDKPNGAKILGIHSEGPYLSRVGEQGVAEVSPKIEMNDVQKMFDDCEGYLKLFAIAPELEGAQEVIDFMNKRGVRVAYAHSDLMYHDAKQAIENGISVITHTCNVMTGIHHRRMGGLGAALLNPDVYNEIIGDGLHVSVEMMELIFKVKNNHSKWLLISDNTPLAGAPKGDYDIGKFKLTISDDGFALTETGRLLGSTKSVLYGMSVLHNQLKLDLETVIRFASTNVHECFGSIENKGTIEVNKDADIAVITKDFECVATFVEGTKVYDRTNPVGFNHNFFKDTRFFK